MAQYLPGGLSANNVRTARAAVMDKLGFGLDPNLIPDPITATINVSNAANIIKASEALAENGPPHQQYPVCYRAAHHG